MEIRACKQCQKTFRAPASSIKKGYGLFCSRQCSSEGRRSDKNPHWKGGEVKIKGYVMLRALNHPFVTKGGYVLRGRLNMEKYLRENDPSSHFLIEHMGIKYLSPDARVLHLDGQKENDNISNLMTQWIRLPPNIKQKTSI